MALNIRGKFRACGQVVSKKVTRGLFGSRGVYTGTVQGTTYEPGSCPHCGEDEPHLIEKTEEEIKKEIYSMGKKY